jgi:hypothetical protein
MKDRENVPGIASIMALVMSVNRTVVFATNASHGALPGQENDPRVLSIALAASFELGVAEPAWTRTAQTHLPAAHVPSLADPAESCST